jgi:hypothetical protein
VEVFETKAERSPQREVVEADETVDAEAGAIVVPRHVADEPAEDVATDILDAEDPDRIDRRAERQRTMSDPVVHRLEERLREPVNGHVEEAARTAASGVREDEERVDRPAGEAVGKESRAARGM